MLNVLFVCIENACRSQMAEAFFNKLAEGKAIASSAGTNPAKKVDPAAVEAMDKYGIDISKNIPKRLELDMGNRFDYIVTMGCTDGCPITPKEKTIEWNIEDPKDKPPGEFERICSEIRAEVEKLISDLLL